MSEDQAAVVVATLERSASYALVTMYYRRGRWVVSAWRGDEECVWVSFADFV